MASSREDDLTFLRKRMEWSTLLNEERLRPKSSLGKAGFDARNAFEADFDRVVFSTPCRRLQDKAQVFPLEPIDAVRTRLTHSMEVSCVAKGIAKNVGKWLRKEGKVDEEQLSSIVTIAATCGLVHDFGNPPFGHSGENAIRDWFAKKLELGQLHPDLSKSENKPYLDDFLHFEGNAQTMRLVMSLQILSDVWGLDLSAGTLSASMKYIAGSDNINKEKHSRKKLGFYQAEKTKANRVRELTGVPVGRNPITLLVEAADDATYCAVDLEDGLKKGVIDWSLIKERVSRVGDFGKDLIRRTENRLSGAGGCGGHNAKEEYFIQYFRTLAISAAVEDAAEKFKANYDDIMAGSLEGELLFDIPTDAALLYGELKNIGSEFVWNSKETIRLELLGRNVIFSLLDHFYDFDDDPRSKSFASKSYKLLSSSYKRVYHSENSEWQALPEGYRRGMLVTDYISGMTDSFATNLHRELCIG